MNRRGRGGSLRSYFIITACPVNLY